MITIEDVPKTIEEARDFGNIRFHEWNEEIRMVIVEIVNSGRQINPHEHPRRDPLGIKAMSLVKDDGRSFSAIMKIASKLGAKIRNY